MRPARACLIATALTLATGVACVSATGSEPSSRPGPARAEIPRPSPSTLAVPTAASDWIRHEVPEESLSLLLPATWERADAFVPGRGANSRFIAADFLPPPTGQVRPVTAPVVEVLRTALPPQSRSDPAAFARDLAAAGTFKGAAPERIDLPLGSAVAYRYRDVLENGLPAHITHYVFVHNGSVYEVVFGASPEHADQYGPVFDRIIRSFAFR